MKTKEKTEDKGKGKDRRQRKDRGFLGRFWFKRWNFYDYFEGTNI